MTRLTTPLLTLALIFMCLCFSNIRVQAEVIPGQVGQYFPTDGLIIDPDNTALEIMGGSVIAPDISCPDSVSTTRDSLVVLNQNEPDNLIIYNIDQTNPNNVQQSTIPVTPNVYGLSRNMYTRADGRIFGSFINDGSFTNGGRLTSTWSDDGLNYDTVQVNSGFNTYGSSTTAPRGYVTIDNSNDNFFPFGNNADPCVGGPNLDNDKYEIFCSPDNGAFWFFAAVSTELVLAALNGGTVSTFGPNGNENFWIFYGSLTGVSYDLRVTDTATGITKTFDTDEPGNTLADSCGVSTPKGNAVIYRNRSEGNIKIVTFDNNNFAPFGGTDPVVRVVGKDPDFNGPGELGFYGFGCTATPDNPNGTDIGFVGPNGKRWDIDLDTGKIFESRVPTPTKNTQSGPNSMNPMCNNTIFTDGFESGDVMA
ncbi:MAG: hypothetical protein IH964_11510 [Candidatus Dadabacteria bacterium]|nr:hypothetical protein [Candidatus Dadabacteria bacterium]